MLLSCAHAGRPTALNSDSELRQQPSMKPLILHCFVSQPKCLGCGTGCTYSSTVKAAAPLGCHWHPLLHQPGRGSLKPTISSIYFSTLLKGNLSILWPHLINTLFFFLASSSLSNGCFIGLRTACF